MAAPGWTTPADVRETRGKKLAGWLGRGYVAGAEFDPVRFPIRGRPAAGARRPVRRGPAWAGEWERAARGPLRVEYKTVGGRSFGVNEIPAPPGLTATSRRGSCPAPRVTPLDGRLAERTRSPIRVAVLAGPAAVKGLDLAGEWDRLLATGWVDRQRQVPECTCARSTCPASTRSSSAGTAGCSPSCWTCSFRQERIDTAGDGFEERYGFRRKPGYVRFRCGTSAVAGFTELAVRVDELTAPPPGTRRAFIVENEVTYLAFPLPADAIVISAAGTPSGCWSRSRWLADLDVVYWGDIDTHGFAILDRLRRTVSRHVRSILMDGATLLAHRSQWVTEPDPTSAALSHLTAAEQSLYHSLRNGTFGERIRLEQEFISFASVTDNAQ